MHTCELLLPSSGEACKAEVLLAPTGSSPESEACLRVRYLRCNPAVLQRYSSDLLALLVQVYNGTVVAQVRF